MLSLHEILLRLGAAFFAGILVGLDRESHGRVAGLRTTILVCVAVAISMIFSVQSGPAVDAHGMIGPDPRVAQGILTGMGFLGGGCIILHGEMVRGVTTAAMLWYVTILGLAFGSGQFTLGFLGLALGLIVLVLLPYIEKYLKNDWYAKLTIVMSLEGPTQHELKKQLESMGPKVESVDVDYDLIKKERMVIFELRVRDAAVFTTSQAVVTYFANWPGVLKVSWI